MADIFDIRASEREIEIKHPGTHKPLGIRILLAPIDDPAVEKIKKGITDRRLNLERRNKGFKAEDIESNRNEILFASMRGWEWYNPTGKEGDEGYNADAMPHFHDEIPDFNRKNVMAILREPKMSWFATQVNEELGEEQDFFNASKTN